jgi:hypothetical protein
MSTSQVLIVFVTLAIAAAFLYLWKRRDTCRTPHQR